MPTARKPSPRSAQAKRAALLFEEMNPSEQIAHTILTEYGDLAPSVGRIMDAGLSDADCYQAITLFQRSLGNLGDPHRDPNVAIEKSRSS
jgi:hypothetical protein